MGKKIVSLLFLLIWSQIFFAQIEKKAYWSVTLDAGISQFDGDMIQTYNTLIPSINFNFALGASAEYTFNPTWGLGLEVYYFPLSAQSGSDSFTSTLIHVNPYFAINTLNLLFRDIDTKWGIWATLGGGIAFYNSKVFLNGEPIGTGINNGRAFIVPVGTLIEYNLNSSLALGLKMQYRSHNKDNLEGNVSYNYKGVTNDFVSLMTFSARWKFAAKTKTHTRNINNYIFAPEEALIPAREAKAKSDSLQFKVDSLRNELADLKPRLIKLEKLVGQANAKPKRDTIFVERKTVVEVKPAPTPEPQLQPTKKDTVPDKSLMNKLLNESALDMKDVDNDGVPNFRDLEPETPANTPVDFWGRTISRELLESFESVYFGFDKSELDEEALTVIKKVAAKLKAQPQLVVEVRGYADFVGNDDYNQKLSQTRANKVKARLINYHGISAKRIIANGKGRLPLPRGASRLSRKCSFLFDN
ncbi:MAG: OmpA/MotB domain protein [Bacteroidetes bacterium]|nr:OmpA/MotB domain protein [Bacteroidota bacterium]